MGPDPTFHRWPGREPALIIPLRTPLGDGQASRGVLVSQLAQAGTFHQSPQVQSRHLWQTTALISSGTPQNTESSVLLGWILQKTGDGTQPPLVCQECGWSMWYPGSWHTLVFNGTTTEAGEWYPGSLGGGGAICITMCALSYEEGSHCSPTLCTRCYWALKPVSLRYVLLPPPIGMKSRSLPHAQNEKAGHPPSLRKVPQSAQGVACPICKNGRHLANWQCHEWCGSLNHLGINCLDRLFTQIALAR